MRVKAIFVDLSPLVRKVVALRLWVIARLNFYREGEHRI